MHATAAQQHASDSDAVNQLASFNGVSCMRGAPFCGSTNTAQTNIQHSTIQQLPHALLRPALTRGVLRIQEPRSVHMQLAEAMDMLVCKQ